MGGGWVNLEMGLGGVANRVARTGFAPSIPVPQYVVDALLQYNGVGRRLAMREAYDCTREGFTLGTDADSEALLAGALEWAPEDEGRGVLHYIARARSWSRAYGGAAIVLLVDDGRKDHEPLDLANIRSVYGARVLNRWEIVPTTWDMRPKSMRVGKPELYHVTIGGSVSMRVHHSRVIIFQGFDLPDQVKRRQNGWGGSIFDLAWSALRNWQVAQDMLPEMITRMTQGVFKSTTLEDGVSAGYKDQIVERFEAMQAGMSVMGDIMIADGEDYSVLSRPISGTGEIMESMERYLVANADGQPKVLIFGETAGGLNSANIGPEMTAWYDHCSGMQRSHYTPPLQRLLDVLARAQDGPTRGVVPNYKIEWVPLYQESQAEIDKAELTRAQRRQIDVTAGVVSALEARTDPDIERLYRTSDETAPAVAGIEPEPDDSELLDDESESVPVVSADAGLIPEGEDLIGVRQAAKRLGYKSAAPVLRMAATNAFPAWRINGRWRVAWSLVESSVRPTAHAPALTADRPD